jgi:GNAT superfamily N-acetyltransferase
MSKPDFTGTWRFNPARSALQIEAPLSTRFTIEHREPRLRIVRTHRHPGGGRDTIGLDLFSDGRETSVDRGDFHLRSRAWWEGDTLVFDSTMLRAGMEASNVVRYTLAADGRSFTAAERFRSRELSYDNTWVLEREDAHEVEVREEPPAGLSGYARIPIAFEVRAVLEVRARAGGAGGFDLVERAVVAPWVKDYDAQPGEGPLSWAARIDVSRWGVLTAWRAGRPEGGAVVAWSTPGVDMLEGRDDLALLWDIRVAPGARGQGVGAALLRAAEDWARARGCRELKVETQDVNVPACRLYEAHGFVLRAADPTAYPGLPGETQLLWYKDL